MAADRVTDTERPARDQKASEVEVGAKTLGEPTIIPSVAAVANAIYNAIGKRIKDLPITRDKLLSALVRA